MKTIPQQVLNIDYLKNAIKSANKVKASFKPDETKPVWWVALNGLDRSALLAAYQDYKEDGESLIGFLDQLIKK